MANRIGAAALILSMAGLAAFLYEIGYTKVVAEEVYFAPLYILCGLMDVLAISWQLYIWGKRDWKQRRLQFLTNCALVLVLLHIILYGLINPPYFALYMIPFMVFLREASMHLPELNRRFLNPGRVFVLSFIMIILLGAVLLEMPNATPAGITFVDALFTATSAVCVTGLCTLDISHEFTLIGQCIILMLIQIGGLGIMTIAAYFRHFFTGMSTYESRIIMGQVTGANRLQDVTDLVRHIITITLLIEFVGVLFMLPMVPQELAPNFAHRLFFSVFHAVSAFCNAGFSTLSGNLYDPLVVFNFPLHIVISIMIILGGLGFFVIEELYHYACTRYHIYAEKHGRTVVGLPSKHAYMPNRMVPHLSMTTRVVLVITGILILLGTVLLFLSEYERAFAGMSLGQKLVGAYFQSVTCRTAGFNTVDLTQFSGFGKMMLVFLMFVGASPASTGGGVKTTALAVAALTIVSILKGRSRVEVLHHALTRYTISRAFSVIVLSLFTIGVSTALLSVTQEGLSVSQLFFEATSAYGTVGLSLNVTPHLDEIGKFIIIATMFLGRITMLTFLLSVVTPSKSAQNKYPNADIQIS